MEGLDCSVEPCWLSIPFWAAESLKGLWLLPCPVDMPVPAPTRHRFAVCTKCTSDWGGLGECPAARLLCIRQLHDGPTARDSLMWSQKGASRGVVEDLGPAVDVGSHAQRCTEDVHHSGCRACQWHDLGQCVNVSIAAFSRAYAVELETSSADACFGGATNLVSQLLC